MSAPSVCLSSEVGCSITVEASKEEDAHGQLCQRTADIDVASGGSGSPRPALSRSSTPAGPQGSASEGPAEYIAPPSSEESKPAASAACLLDGGLAPSAEAGASNMENAASASSQAVASEDDEGSSGGPSDRQAAVYSAFIRKVASDHPSVMRSPLRAKLGNLLNSSTVETSIAMLIICNFFLICLETDSGAVSPEQHRPEGPPIWVSAALDSCFFVFVAELLLRLYVEQRRFLRSSWNCLDAFVVLLGGVELLLKVSGVDLAGFGLMRVVRIFRLIRLLRVMRLFSFLKELRRLLQMMGSCFKTLFWSFLMLVLVMTMWAVVAVEVLNPLVQDVASKSSAWEGCDRCRRSFSSTFMANLTFFQTVVAGDSWGFIAVPVIEAYPWSASIFIGALLTLVFGVLNLIVAVIVDTFAESREKDVVSRAADMDAEEIEEKKVLAKMFERIDADGGGTLSYEELQASARRVPEFRNWLRVLDIDAQDLRRLFSIIDEDASGEIDPFEFVEAMYRMKNIESKTAMKFVKHLVTKLDEDQQSFRAEFGKDFLGLSSAVEESLRYSKQALENVAEHGAATKKVVDVQEELFQKTEEALQQKLREQEETVKKTVEIALGRASTVAWEAALQAAAASANDVMATVSCSSTESAKFQRQTSPGSSPSIPAPQSEACTSKCKRSTFEHGVSDGTSNSTHAVVSDFGALLDSLKSHGKSSLAQFYDYSGPNGAPSSCQPANFEPEGFQDCPRSPESL